MPSDARRKGPGRPRTRPAGAKFRGVWLTDAEYRAVQLLVRELRAGRRPK